MTTITEASAALTTAEANVEAAEQALEQLRQAASQGEPVTPTELGNAESAAEIARLQVEHATKQLDAATEADADEKARAFAKQVDTYAAKKPDFEKLLNNFRTAAKEYISATTEYNKGLKTLVSQASKADPHEQHTTPYRVVRSRTRGIPSYGETLGLDTTNSTQRYAPSPEEELNKLFKLITPTITPRDR